MNEYQERALNSLAELCNIFPEQRLGQIISNYVLAKNKNDCFYLSDKQFAEIIEQQVQKIKLTKNERIIKKAIEKHPIIMDELLEIVNKYEKIDENFTSINILTNK